MEIKKGLEDIAIKETEITYIDGNLGRLYYRGYSIFDLAEFSNFEETAYLIWFGKLPNSSEIRELKEKLAEERNLPEFVIQFIKNVRKDANAMDVLRTAISMLGIEDNTNNNKKEELAEKAIKITSKIPTIISYFVRTRKNLDIVEPDPSLGHAENFLYMLKGEKPSNLETKVMDVSLLLHMDHEMNASTFACLVVASTLSDIYSSIVAGISALKGPLHGGANAEALKQFMEIKDKENVEEYIMKKLESGQRIMGFGHRIYKSYDPRAKILKEYAKIITKEKGLYNLYEVAEKVDEIGSRILGKKGIYPNVDFYAGLVFYSLGFEPDLFPTVFASARVVGWTAHIMEYLKDNKLIRPKAIYKGEIGRKYISINERE
ncbi:citrate synthase [Acidianus sulfidivorans JP7]|uniref:Citrate synthase n=1 Tax=Acidianus sulfidivorans JP7 TaxID=619593 RepID=A0A2U9IKE7_9CREN|nr:citrate synthase/methylcitrate synthase [Acidianus sulfidivorans]AWR96404.1 citrate synthase [Acidianus sulfidivorans JP7]